MGAYTLHAKGKTNTGPARKAFDDRFRKQVDPDGILPDDERERRAEHAKRAYFAGLALKSATARRKARKFTAEANAADHELARLADEGAPDSGEAA